MIRARFKNAIEFGTLASPAPFDIADLRGFRDSRAAVCVLNRVRSRQRDPYVRRGELACDIALR